ncbi:QWRF family [Sesbania bispinosa]|nr:QWRF family [Sesbania bispinosa]
MKTHNDSPVSSSSPKPRQHRNRDSNSRFHPSPPSSFTTSMESSESLSSPVRRKSSSPGDNRKQKITEDLGFTRHQLWPSSAKRNSGTLADHINDDRFIEQLDAKTEEKEKPKKRSSNVLQRRFENDETASISFKEIGGSARYTGRFASTSRDSRSFSLSSKKLGSDDSSVVSGRFSLDENAKSRSSNLHSLTNSLDLESHYGDAGLVSPASGKASSSRKAGVEVPSRFMNDVTTSRRSRRGTSDSNIGNLNGDSSVLKKFALKSAIKRTNSLTGYKSSKTQWALSPGRSESPAMSVESMEKPMSFSSLKQPNSATPTKVKGVEKFLTMGFDLFKSKKSTVLNSPPAAFGNVNSEVVHQLRLLDNRLIQWRYANAKAQTVNANISHHAESNLIYAWDGLTKLRHSVLKKKIQFAREKLEMKIAFVLYHQMKLLEVWGGMERQHVSAITATKECLHSVVCRVPLLEGAKVNMQSTSFALRQASDIAAPIKSILTSFSPLVDKTAAILSELAKVVAQEKQLLQEFYDLFQTIYFFELQERSMKCNLIQLESWQQKNQHQLLLQETTS